MGGCVGPDGALWGTGLEPDAECQASPVTQHGTRHQLVHQDFDEPLQGQLGLKYCCGSSSKMQSYQTFYKMVLSMKIRVV